jgi:hypothetical protein
MPRPSAVRSRSGRRRRRRRHWARSLHPRTVPYSTVGTGSRSPPIHPCNRRPREARSAGLRLPDHRGKASARRQAPRPRFRRPGRSARTVQSGSVSGHGRSGSGDRGWQSRHRRRYKAPWEGRREPGRPRREARGIGRGRGRSARRRSPHAPRSAGIRPGSCPHRPETRYPPARQPSPPTWRRPSAAPPHGATLRGSTGKPSAPGLPRDRARGGRERPQTDLHGPAPPNSTRREHEP